MRTSDDVRHDLVSVTPDGRLFDGIGRTALVAAFALTGCTLLVAVGTVLSLCWMIHPALTFPAALAVLWIAARLAGRLFRTCDRAR